MTWLGDQLSHIADEMPQRDLGAAVMERHQRRRRTLVAFAAAATVVVTLLAATAGVRAFSAEPPTVVGPSLPLERSTIKVGFVPTVESAVLFVAQRMGYFQEEGLSVQAVFLSGSTFGVPMLGANRLDLAQLDYATVFKANEHGKDLKIVTASHQSAPGTLAVVVNATSKVRTVAGLKRKRIAVPELGGLPPLALTAVLERAGLTSEDVVLIEIPYQQMLGGLKQGRYDAALLAEPFITLGREGGQVRVVGDAMSGDLANLQTSGMTATEDWIRRNPRTLAAFQRALGKARRLVTADPEQARAALPVYTRISAKAARNATLGSYPDQLDPTHLTRIAVLARAHGWLKRLPEPGEAVATTE
ncbi:ABC transporter substrate-binding protein [Nonomuraea bangladeshensis]|uniref:ABC transporter substrate-binding protein n=1 Tax=Nonomuraea bangladeshensis TaxID=404385 RepID=UPI003C30D0A9